MRGKKKPKYGVWILSDQLSPDIASLQKLPKAETLLVMIEAQAVPVGRTCHKKKLILHFAAMRHFRDELTELG